MTRHGDEKNGAADKPRRGSALDGLLEEEGLLDEVTAAATGRILEIGGKDTATRGGSSRPKKG